MKISSFTIYKYSLALQQPVYIRGAQIAHREGLIVKIVSPEGFEGFGEISPLAGRSAETLNEAYEQTLFLKSNFTGELFPQGMEKLDGKFQSWFEGGIGLIPSVQFGIEMAVLNLLANAKQIPLFKLLSNEGRPQVRVSALLDGTRHEVVRQAQRLKEEGCTAMKLKVHGSIEESAVNVQAVRDVLKEDVLLYLDANQSWSLEEAIIFGREIEKNFVSYIEEPIKNVYQIPEFYKETMIPVALDESLLKLSFGEIQALEGVDVLVLKPTLLGGIEKAWQIAQQTKAVGMRSVISSSFETGLGILTLANLAGCSARDDEAGLDTLKWFRQDLLNEKLAIDGGKIDISSRAIRETNINLNLLKEIA
jgi:O-succinylbenzoate synthase